MRRRNNKISSTRRWHRLLGAAASIFVVFIVLSGLALNHAHQIGLDRHFVSSPALLHWYGLDGPVTMTSFEADGHWLTSAGSQLYLDGAAVATADKVVGAITTGEGWLIACRKELLLLTRTGELVERMPWDLPGAGPATALGRAADGRPLVASAGRIWQADAELLDWEALEKTPASASWSSPGAAPSAVKREVAAQYRGRQMTVEQLLLDLHSGRIFGQAGVLAYDLLALILGFLALSGLILWWRGRRNGRLMRKS